MAFANAHGFSINQPLMFDQSNSNNIVNQINMIASGVQIGRLSPINQVPPSTTQMFTGQEIYLEALNKHFKNDKNDKSRKYFLLYGIGGIGKTQICLKYKDDAEDDYEYMFWIDATSNETIIQSLKDIYKSYPAVQQSAFSANAVLNWISSLKSKWLMVYDNADGAPEVVENFLPPGNKGNILITSRNQALGGLTTNKYAMEVTEMSTDIAIMLLLKSSGLDFQYEQYKEIADDIVSELYGIPLAIAQAGAYIMHGECDITNYLDIYRKHRVKLLSNEQYGGASKYNKSVYGTWELSYQQLIQISESSNKAAAATYAINMINLSAFYHYMNISIAIFERAAENYSKRMEKYADDIRPIFLKSMDPDLFNIDENNMWNEMIFNQAIALLLSFSLIRKDSSKYFSFHPLIQQWCQDRLHQTDRLHWILVSGGMLATSITYEDTITETVYRRQITLHLSNIETKLTGLQCYHDIFSTLALASESVGIYMNAENLLKEVVNLNEEFLGQDHSDTMYWKRVQGVIYNGLGKLSEAEGLQIKLLESSKSTLGDEHPDTLASINNLANTFVKLGKLTEAEGLLIQVLEARKRILGDEHPDTLTSMNNLAYIFSDLRKLPEAEGLQIQVLEASRRILGDDHPVTLACINNLANTFSELGKLSEAEGLQSQVLDACKRILGDEHPNTLASMSQLASTYSKLGKLSEAEGPQIQVLEACKRILGDEHPHTLISMNNLASTYSKLGKLSEAKGLQIQVLEARKRILGDEHPDTQTSMNNLAYYYGKLGKWSEAETLKLEELEKQKNIWGYEHPNTLECMIDLFQIYLKCGKVSEAEQLRLQIIDTRERMKTNGVALDENLQMWYDYVYNTSRFSEDTYQQIDLDEVEEESSSRIVKKESKMRRFVGKFKKSLKLHK